MPGPKQRYKKGKVKVIHKSKGISILHLTMPPKSTTGRHKETRPYVVVPLTGGQFHRVTYHTARGKETTKQDKWRVKPLVPYVRQVDTPLDHELFNHGNKPIKVLKYYPTK